MGGCCRVLVLYPTSTLLWPLQVLLLSVKSDDRLTSAVDALESEVTSLDVQRAKSLSASGKRPLFRSCEAIAFAVTGHLECVVLLPVSLFMVCHALRLDASFWVWVAATAHGECQVRVGVCVPSCREEPRGLLWVIE